jgi:hypothetical protein
MLRDGVELEAGEARRRKTEVGSWELEDFSSYQGGTTKVQENI